MGRFSERFVAAGLIGAGFAGLFFMSSAGVAEGLLYGPGRFWPFFVAVKAGSACLLLFLLMVLFGRGLRSLIRRRRALMVEHPVSGGVQ